MKFNPYNTTTVSTSETWGVRLHLRQLGPGGNAFFIVVDFWAPDIEVVTPGTPAPVRITRPRTLLVQPDKHCHDWEPQFSTMNYHQSTGIDRAWTPKLPTYPRQGNLLASLEAQAAFGYPNIFCKWGM
jgi:hypothetical protein